jgi:hypothetical protein
MSEYAPEDVTDEPVEEGSSDAVEDVDLSAQETAEPVRTGLEGVDAVLRSIEDLEGTPVDEHVAVFEQAHERLRGVLDAGT